MNRLPFLLTLFLLAAARLCAAPVTVSGHVLNADGTPATDWPVFVGQPNPNGSGDMAFTDFAGFYTLVVDVPTGDSLISVQTFDHCGEQVQEVPVLAGTASADFVLCFDPGWSNCWLDAYYQPGSGLSAQFFGQGYGQDSLAAFTYAWDFGDGSTSTDQNPLHTYAAAGDYIVTLTATSADCTVTITLWVSVYPTQQVTVTGQVLDQNGSPVPDWFVYLDSNNPTFPNYGTTDAQGMYFIQAALPETATTVTANTWDFCSPNGLSGTAPIVNGTATIDFVICYDSFPPPPDCGAYITYTQVDGLTYQFSANTYAADSNATFTYVWDFGDGTTSTEANPQHTYAQAGMYSVLLTVTSSTGCQAVACEVVCTYGGGVIDTFYYGCQAMYGLGWGGPTTTGGFDPLTVQFYDMSFGVVNSWHWDFGDNTTDTTQNPVHTYAASGLYTVTLSITTLDGCESSITMEIYVGDDFPWTEYDCQAMFLPIPDSTGNGLFFIDLSTTNSPIQSWQWDFGDGSTSTEQNPYHVYTQPGVYTVSLTIQADSCNSIVSFEIDTNNPFGQFKPGGGVLGLSANASSTRDVAELSELKAFPNPASSELTLAFSSLKGQDAELRLSNVSGQLVRTQMISTQAGPNALRLPVQDLTPGLYLLQLRSAGQVQTLKVVKE